MIRKALPALLSLLALWLAACTPGESLSPPSDTLPSLTTQDVVAGEPSPTAAATQPMTAATTVDAALDEAGEATITLPISLYIVDDEGGAFSSHRSAEQLDDIYRRVNDIWSQAGIAIDVRSIQRITLPSEVVEAIVAGDFEPFLDGAGRQFDIPDPSLLNAFYAREIGGPNGIVPFGARLFFVNDEPSVHHERVSSHEIGHILGLHHTLSDRERLLFPGTNGRELTQEEIGVSRYVAQGLLDRLR